jgi:hypothetical protein
MVKNSEWRIAKANGKDGEWRIANSEWKKDGESRLVRCKTGDRRRFAIRPIRLIRLIGGRVRRRPPLRANGEWCWSR